MQSRKVILYFLVVIHFTNIMDVMIMMPLADLFIEEFDITAAEFSLLISSYGIAAFFSSLCGVFLLDRFDRRAALMFIYAGFAIGTLLCAVMNDFMSLLVLRFITGLFGGIIGALALSIVSDVYPFKERGQAIAILMTGFSIAAALGVPAGFYFATTLGWRFPFFAIGGLAAIVWMVAWYAFPSVKVHERGRDLAPYDLIIKILRNANIRNALLLSFILILGHFMIIPFITPYMTQNVGFAQIEITYIYLTGGTLTVVIAPIIGWLTDRYGVRLLFFSTMILSFVPVVWLTNLGPQPLIYGLIVTTLFFVLGSGRILPPQSLITSAVGSQLRGSFMCLKSAVQQLAMASAAAIGGFIIAEGPDQKIIGFEWVGYLSVVVCILAMFVVPRIKVAKGN